MKDYWEETTTTKPKKINKKKIIIGIAIIIILIALITTAILYVSNKEIREWMDKNLLRKEVMQNNVTTIDIEEGQYANIYAFNKYIGILNKNKFKIYGNTGNEEKELEVQVSNPIFDSSNRFLAIAETKGQRVYLITDKEITWDTQVEGNISQVHVNKNGYVAVVIVGTSHKTVIEMYDPQGNKMFKSFLASTRTADVAISNDNKYLAIAEVNTAGTVIQSSIKIISIEKAKSTPTESLENTYESESGKLITNIEYQDKGKLICMYTDSISIIENGQENVLADNQNKKVIFMSIALSNNVCEVEEKSSGLFTADSLVNIINIDNKNIKEYTAESVAKEIYTYGNIIALNLGTEIEFINTEGWLVKRYIANQEITNVVVSDSIAGIIYRDKIEIVNL